MFLPSKKTAFANIAILFLKHSKKICQRLWVPIHLLENTFDRKRISANSTRNLN